MRIKQGVSSAFFTSVLTLVAFLVAPAAHASSPASGGQSTVAAASGTPGGMLRSVAGFAPGNIIDDAVFFDSASMTEAQIQAFLESKVPSCRSGYTCLRDKRDTSRTTSADAMCGAYSGAADERASRIIYKVAQACGISPRVLLVTLQKEQGLVTHTWPSDWRYTIAMGQGCPDTAACDTRYYGFFNQVFGAAWQFKRYANPPGTSAYFTWYAPARTWNVQYHPNRDCGSSPVRIENQATANLYYYTPYQPNAASLAAGFGQGDSCSSYGNRNFYNYFTDWFGSTQGGERILVRTAADPSVWLLSGSDRWHVADGDDYQDLAGTFGSARVVSEALVASYASRGTTGAVLRNETTGEIALIQGGQRHRFGSCDLVGRWGVDCLAAVSVADSLFARAGSGAEMTPYYRVRSSSAWGRLDTASSTTPLHNEAAVRATNGDPSTAVYGAYIRTSRLQALQKQPVMFAPAQLVKADNSDRVYLTTDFDGLRWVPSWDSVLEYNRTNASLAVVPGAELLARYHEVGTVAPMLSCDGATYYPGSGYLHALSDSGRTGLTSMTATAATCAQFSRGASVNGALFVKTASGTGVSAIEEATARPVASWTALVAFNDGVVPTIVTVRAATLNAMNAGVPIADGEVIKSSSAAALSLVSQTTAHAVPSYALAAELGLRMSYVTLPDAQAAKLTTGAVLGHWMSCSGTVYFGAEGKRHAVAATAAADFAVPPMSTPACARIPRSDAPELPRVLVKAVGSADIYIAQAGVYRHVTSMSALMAITNGTAPVVLSVSVPAFAALPKGAPIT